MAKKKKSFPVMKDGVFVYLGPSIRGTIQKGSIYRGTRDQVLAGLADVIKKYPYIASLVVADTDITTVKVKIKTGGNGYSAAYKALSTVTKEGG